MVTTDPNQKVRLITFPVRENSGLRHDWLSIDCLSVFVYKTYYNITQKISKGYDYFSAKLSLHSKTSTLKGHPA